MAGRRCSCSRHEMFSKLETGEVATCYGKDKHEDVSGQLGEEIELSNLQQLVNETVIDCGKQQNEILQEVDIASGLLENHNQRVEQSVAITREPNTQIQELNKKLGELHETNVGVEESIVQNGKSNKQIRELNKKIGEMQETNVKLAQEKEVQEKEFEALNAELAKKNKEFEEKIIALLKENEGQRNVIESLKDISEEKMFELEEENAELGRRNLVLEEKQVHHEGRIADLDITLDCLTTDLESCRQIADEKEAQLIGLQYQFPDLVKENMYLEDLNSALVSDLNKCTKVLEENVYLHHIRRELDISSHSLSNDLESKDILLQQFMTSEHKQLKSEYQHFH